MSSFIGNVQGHMAIFPQAS